MRFNSTFSQDKYISLDNFLEKLPKTQDKIYFIVNPQVSAAMSSPYMEPFKGTDIPVLILTNNIDELCF